MELLKVKKNLKGIVAYDYYKVIAGKKVKITNNEYIELELLEGKTIEKDSDFNQSNRSAGLMFKPIVSSSVKKLEKKLINQTKKISKKPRLIDRYTNKLNEIIDQIKLNEKLLNCGYDESCIDIQVELQALNKAKEKYQKKIQKLVQGKTRLIKKENNDFLVNNQYLRSLLSYTSAMKRKEQQEKEIRNNPFYPFNSSLTLAQKKSYLRSIGIII